MKEKEPVKIKLSTAILLFIILILIGGIVYFALQNNMSQNKQTQDGIEMQTLKSENEELKNTIEENNIITNTVESINTNAVNNTTTSNSTSSNTQQKSGTKLIQFDTEFYDMKDVALAYRNLSEIKNYKDFEYDLDGDGKKDKITIKQTDKDEYNDFYYHAIYLNGKEFYSQESSDEVSIYIIDLNKNDNIIDVVIHELNPNDINTYLIYSKNGVTMKKNKELIGWKLSLDEKGKIIINNSLLESIKPEIYDVYYKINNGKVEENRASIENIKNTILKSEGGLCFTQDKSSLKKYHNRNYSNEEYGENYDEKKALEKYGIYYYEKELKFKIIKFEDSDFANGCMKVKLEDGREGYLFSFAYNLAG